VPTVVGGNGGKSIKLPTTLRTACTINVSRTLIESQVRQQVREPRVRSAPAMECNPASPVEPWIDCQAVRVTKPDDSQRHFLKRESLLLPLLPSLYLI